MGVYITGMEMPKSCRDCGIEQEGFWCGALDGYQNTRCFTNERREDCPLIEIPPHGRLIDESAIELSKYENAAHDALHNGKGSILYDSGVLAGARAITRLVRNAPTIIPAEEGE